MALGHGAAELDRDKNRMCLAHGRQFFISQKAAIASFFLRRFWQSHWVAKGMPCQRRKIGDECNVIEEFARL